MAQQRAPFRFPSPSSQLTHDQQFLESVSHAKNTMKAYTPAVMRQAVREMWELTLVGSDYHSDFICSTMFHRATPAALSAAVEQQGARLVQSSSVPIAKHLRTGDLDSMASVLLPKMSPEFLDQALTLRLETIGAQPLVNLLGRAERLGYDTRDVVTENQSARPPRQERVIPTANPIPVPPAAMMPQHASQQQPQPQLRLRSTNLPSDADVLRLGIAFCESCNRPCGGPKALKSHLRSGLCGSPPVPLHKFGKDNCLFCGQHFTGNGGLAYHMNNKVCGGYNQEHADVLTAFFVGAQQGWTKDMEQKPATPVTGSSNSQTPASRGRHDTTRVVPMTRVTPASTPSRQSEEPTSASKDPYAALSPTMRVALDAALARVEHQYSEAMKKTLMMEPEAGKAELARLKNLYNNKMSMTRKKFGVRLRERRPRAVIDSERDRMLSTRLDDTPPPLSASTAGSTSKPGTPKQPAAAGERRESIPASLQAGSAPARPLPMSIAGSYTTPIRAPDDAPAAGASANGTEPIAVEDEDSEDGGTGGDEEEGDEDKDDEDEDDEDEDDDEDNRTSTEMDVDE